MKSRTAWRVEGTLREFPKFPPVQVWFDYPRHRVDDRGILKDLESESAAPAWKKAVSKHKKSAAEKSVNEKQKFEDAVNNCNMGEPPTLKDLVQWYSDSGKEVTERTVRNWVKKFGFSIDKNNGTVVKSF